ncbi:cellulose biosynthesis protein BcsP [Caballeronia sp.]|uniref:cellulose biosynthesis protein BcsP n=1 Tax=Caballeronia sp. TaxID=1931223 RepID=UPI003C4DE5B5
MNPSRDIEKLFDHFGGNASDYQEIGRDNEARNARTRWPLLSALDLSLPAIPGVAPRRDSLLPRTRGTGSSSLTPPASATSNATPIGQGKPPLFARAHRQTIPPVSNVTLPAANLGGMRFSELAEAVGLSSGPADATVAAPVSVDTTLPAVESRAQPFAGSSESMRFSSVLQRSPKLANPPSLPRIPLVAPAQAAQTASANSDAVVSPAQPNAPSILAKMFAPQPHAQRPSDDDAAALPDSLHSIFQRLRGPNSVAPAAAESALAVNAPATASWLAIRTARK